MGKLLPLPRRAVTGKLLPLPRDGARHAQGYAQLQARDRRNRRRRFWYGVGKGILLGFIFALVAIIVGGW